MNIENPLKIKKNIIKSPKKKSNKLSAELKRRLSQKVNDTVLPIKPSPDNIPELKKIQIPVKKKSKKSKLIGFIPTNLSETLKLPEPTPEPTLEPTPEPTNEKIDSSVSKEKPMNFKKKSKTKKLSRKKSTKSKTISVKLDDEDKNKEKDILNIIDKFEKMDVKDIKEFLEKKGISSKNNNKSKLLPYLYLLTCVDDDINIIKN